MGVPSFSRPARISPYSAAAPADLAQQLASERLSQLKAWNLALDDLRRFRAGTHIRVLTPGSSAGEPSTSSPPRAPQQIERR
jgi:hypothetical protein